MYDTSHSSVSAPMNGLGGDLIDGSGTINPAALNSSSGMSQKSLFLALSRILHFLFYPEHASSTVANYALIFCYFFYPVAPLETDNNNYNNRWLVAAAFPAPSTAESSNTSPRGVKRSRTPDHLHENAPTDDIDDGMCALKLSLPGNLQGRRGLSNRFLSIKVSRSNYCY